MEVWADLTTFWGQFTYIYEPCWESWWRKWDTFERNIESIITCKSDSEVTLTLQLNVAQILTCDHIEINILNSDLQHFFNVKLYIWLQRWQCEQSWWNSCHFFCQFNSKFNCTTGLPLNHKIFFLFLHRKVKTQLFEIYCIFNWLS